MADHTGSVRLTHEPDDNFDLHPDVLMDNMLPVWVHETVLALGLDWSREERERFAAALWSRMVTDPGWRFL